MTNNLIEIPKSNSKIIKITIGCTLVVLLGIYFVIKPDLMELEFFGFALNNTYLGFTLVIVFGFFLLLLIKQLLAKGAGLMIDNGGITDNSSFTAMGFISWRDIEDITTINLKGQDLILINVVNPNEYVNNIPGGMKRNILLLNIKSTGTPIAISATGLKTTHDELLLMMKENFNKYRKK
jgi:hypothetical protein